MSANSLENFVIVFPDPGAVPDGSAFNPERLPANVSFANEITTDLQTLSTNDADPNGSIQGLLYVPDIAANDPCFNLTKDLIPRNATTQSDLPNVDFNLVALAPWISVECTKSFLESAHYDPIRAFIFYLPNNETGQPPPISDAIWDLYDGGQWRSQTPYPVYAIPGYLGAGLMTALSLYSGNVSSVPFGHTLLNDYELDPRDYVRIYTEIQTTDSSTLPGLWVFLLIVLGALAVILASTSFTMHWLQRRRREALRRRVASGDVDLEALGIKRLTVPQYIIDKMPLFLYTCSDEESPATRVSDPPVNTKTGSLLPSPVNTENPPSISADAESIERSTRSTLPVAHDYLPHSQPTCPVCLDDFVSQQTSIRELPCLHIFHPECIDSFLSNHSSLCPMCKKSSLPLGYCPATITNAMVTRERAIRRLRGSITLPLRMDASDMETGHNEQSRMRKLRDAVSRRIPFWGQRVVESRPTRNAAAAYTGGAVEMQPIVQPVIAQRREINPNLTRADRAQLRARELLGGTVIEDAGGPSQSSWRRAISKVFPGFK